MKPKAKEEPNLKITDYQKLFFDHQRSFRSLSLKSKLLLAKDENEKHKIIDSCKQKEKQSPKYSFVEKEDCIDEFEKTLNSGTYYTKDKKLYKSYNMSVDKSDSQKHHSSSNKQTILNLDNLKRQNSLRSMQAMYEDILHNSKHYKIDINLSSLDLNNNSGVQEDSKKPLALPKIKRDINESSILSDSRTKIKESNFDYSTITNNKTILANHVLDNERKGKNEEEKGLHLKSFRNKNKNERSLFSHYSNFGVNQKESKKMKLCNDSSSKFYLSNVSPDATLRQNTTKQIDDIRDIIIDPIKTQNIHSISQIQGQGMQTVIDKAFKTVAAQEVTTLSSNVSSKEVQKEIEDNQKLLLEEKKRETKEARALRCKTNKLLYDNCFYICKKFELNTMDFNKKVCLNQESSQNHNLCKILALNGQDRKYVDNKKYLTDLNLISQNKIPPQTIFKKYFTEEELMKIKASTKYYINNDDFIESLEVLKPTTLVEKIKSEDRKNAIIEMKNNLLKRRKSGVKKSGSYSIMRNSYRDSEIEIKPQDLLRTEDSFIHKLKVGGNSVYEDPFAHYSNNEKEINRWINRKLSYDKKAQIKKEEENCKEDKKRGAYARNEEKQNQQERLRKIKSFDVSTLGKGVPVVCKTRFNEITEYYKEKEITKKQYNIQQDKISSQLSDYKAVIKQNLIQAMPKRVKKEDYKLKFVKVKNGDNDDYTLDMLIKDNEVQETVYIQ